MPSKLPQFHQAWSALQKENTSEFNKSYGYISPPSSRPTTPVKNLNKTLEKRNKVKTRRRRNSLRKSRKNRRNH